MQVLGPGSSRRPNRRGWELVAFGFLPGLAGSSVALDVPFVSRWYAGPGQGGARRLRHPERQFCDVLLRDGRCSAQVLLPAKWVHAAGPAAD